MERLHQAASSAKSVSRFWQKVAKGGEDECWLWGASKNWKGYGQFCLTIDGKSAPHAAHRVSWMLEHGAIHGGLLVLHRCDNPACVNPKHLFLGTEAENSADMKAKGRQSKGSARPLSKLNEAAVLQIRTRPGTSEQIAKEFGVSPTAILKIKRGQSWRHVA